MLIGFSQSSPQDDISEEVKPVFYFISLAVGENFRPRFRRKSYFLYCFGSWTLSLSEAIRQRAKWKTGFKI